MKKGTDDANVGDINSSDKGSGARYNAGKPDMSLIPLEAVVNSFIATWETTIDADHIVSHVGDFQMGGDVTRLHVATNRGADYWADCAKVFEYGKEKYAAWNWAKGMAWSIPIACIGRHYLAIRGGQENDEESGLPHIGHIMCNIVMLIHFVEHYPEGDDRIKHAD